MNILVTGASGLIGQALIPVLTTGGHRVTSLVRFKPRGGESLVYWNPAAGDIDAPKLEGFGAVVHLAGEPITGRSEERRVGKECWITCRSRWSPYH